MAESKRYHYFDTPEGQDVHRKLWVVLKPATLTGVALSTIDVLCFPVYKTYGQILGRYAYYTFPIMGIAGAFVITSNLARNYRNKDDMYNWGAGALASAGLFGAWRRSIRFGCAAALAFTALAMGKKYVLMQGWEFFPERNNQPVFNSLYAPRYDYSLTKERPRNWTRGD